MKKPGVTENGSSLLNVFFSQRHRLVGLATRIIGCRSQAEDIVHDAYMKMGGSACQTEEIRSEASYVTRVVRNLSIDHYRRRQLEDRLMCREQEPDDTLERSTGTPEDLVSDQQALERIACALNDLPERTRHVFEMCRVHGMKQKDIADALGISPALVSALIHEAVLHCRQAV
jgi:RNA polymerase sigma-70 factor (ECF subfamily)